MNIKPGDIVVRCQYCERLFVMPSDPDPHPLLCESCIQDPKAIAFDRQRKGWDTRDD